MNFLTLERVEKVFGRLAVQGVSLDSVTLSKSTTPDFGIGPVVVVVTMVKEEEAAHDQKVAK